MRENQQGRFRRQVFQKEVTVCAKTFKLKIPLQQACQIRGQQAACLINEFDMLALRSEGEHSGR